MERIRALRHPYLVVMAAVAWLAVVLQILLVVGTVIAAGQPPILGIINTLSYFTVLTNIMVAVVATASAARARSAEVETGSAEDRAPFQRDGAKSRFKEKRFRSNGADTVLTRADTMSAVAVYIFVVGLTYSLLLRDLWEPTGLRLAADMALHDVLPILYIFFWLAFVPKGTLRWDQPIWWLIYPVAYFVYFMLFGTVTGRYLYPFGDVTMLGYPRVLANGGIFALAFFVFGLIAVAIDHAMARTRNR